MSLYNALFGRNPFADLLLTILKLTQHDVPRFRDCYIDDCGQIVIYTRTGGNNRFDFAKEIEKLQSVPGYVKDKDDSFDSTYAYFYFEVPEEFKPMVAGLGEEQGHFDPKERFQQLLKDLTEKNETPETRRALEVGEAIFAALDKGISKIVV
jgi:hypothetical protein